ncbi:hypothetical protein [Paenibacillus mesotrionivorans]|uniref:Uncharacterized protein n=1 Tax=Paenibacillus mesotrionivorans TaxID=3160968 RepID=A0ACC7NZB0_9BACL
MINLKPSGIAQISGRDGLAQGAWRDSRKGAGIYVGYLPELYTADDIPP